jgi:AraC-like DNA-binding protein
MDHRVHLYVSRGREHADEFPGPVHGTSSVLVGLVDGMADWDIACADQAKALTIKAIPGTAPFLMVHYRTPVVRFLQFGSHGFRHPQDRHFATKLQSGAIIAQPRGPLGTIVVRFRPEAAVRLLGEPLRHLLDAQIRLDDLFGGSRAAVLEEMLAEAKTSAERFACLETFLVANLRPRQDESIGSRAAALLGRSPHMRIRQLAARLDVSERHLSRSFNETFGMGPKQFARIARIEKAWALRSIGAQWADIAYATGFADQAHMIRDFTEIVGMSPAQLLLPESGAPAKTPSPQGSDVWLSW